MWLQNNKIMETSIIKIGNSKGLRLSKTILEKYNIGNKVEMILGKDRIVIKPIEKPREGWTNAFKKMAKNKDDTLLIDDVFEDENIAEWN